ncbi:MAG: hypothetical protein ACI4HI_07620, partial [Lachnospiraceae bacterium]
ETGRRKGMIQVTNLRRIRKGEYDETWAIVRSLQKVLLGSGMYQSFPRQKGCLTGIKQGSYLQIE